MGTWQRGCPPWSDLGDTCPLPPHPVKTPQLQESGHPVSASPSFATRKAFPLFHLRPSCCLSPPGAQRRSTALEEGALSPPVGPHGGAAQRDLALPCALRWSPAGALAGLQSPSRLSLPPARLPSPFCSCSFHSWAWRGLPAGSASRLMPHLPGSQVSSGTAQSKHSHSASRQ